MPDLCTYNDAALSPTRCALSLMKTTFNLIFWSLIGLGSAILLVLTAAFLYLNPQIPDTRSFSEVALKAPLRIYSDDGLLIQEFGERLTPVTFNEIPPLFIKALLDTEDKRFFEHGGIDLVTLVNASWQLVRNRGAIRTGASTITMQLVKNISGDTEVRFLRKFKEMLLALKIERELSKEDILTLYLNIIPFGKHAFGIQAAANTYYGKDVNQLSLAQQAMLAGIPAGARGRKSDKRSTSQIDYAPQPGADYACAAQGSISQAQYEEAIQAPITAQVIRSERSSCPHFTRRKWYVSTYYKNTGRQAYNQGMIAHTTLSSQMQRAAEAAVNNKSCLSTTGDTATGGPNIEGSRGQTNTLPRPSMAIRRTGRGTLAAMEARSVGQHPGIVTQG